MRSNRNLEYRARLSLLFVKVTVALIHNRKKKKTFMWIGRMECDLLRGSIKARPSLTLVWDQKLIYRNYSQVHRGNRQHLDGHLDAPAACGRKAMLTKDEVEDELENVGTN